MNPLRLVLIVQLTAALVSCGSDDPDDASPGVAGNGGASNVTGGSAGGDAAPSSGGGPGAGGTAGAPSGSGGSDSGDRTPVSGGCARSSGDACTSDADCVTGGCGRELCYGVASGEGITTCDCTAPAGSSCGCVDGACTWWE
jgi:hypothetical protein